MNIIKIDKTQGHLVYDLFDQYRVFYKQQSDIVTAKKFVQERLDNNESIIFVALGSNNQPFGFTQLYPQYSSVRVMKYWLLNDLYVAKEYRKQGIGERLIKTAIDFAKENNSKYIDLSTAIDNYTAQSLYERIGFNRLAQDTDFFNYRISLKE